MSAFEYAPGVMAQQVQMVNETSQVLDDIEQRALQKLAAVKEFWDSQGSTAYEDAQQIITNGINEGKQVLQRQAHVTDNSHQEAMATDMGAANSIGAF
ncbi:WXG100 family type VII secretion target [Mycolicibacterium mageritense]|uniref:WXG100 family type VII secretion target n=1 Tax=Mycolicibacterium mageritense TaxID=53462 RepID=UPI0011D37E49|nr:WXG100 family type VII secretion target [Mycolicibacterium mageritense]TXI55753.1 MAG: hypothetical protein E6Q55_30555 [Mycolicibacterium mageritense]